MQFKKYQHIERWGTDEVQDIEFGTVYVFPKIDGTNGSVWLDDSNNICGGSRQRTLLLDNDNQGFYEYVMNNKNILNYLTEHPTHRLFGEWLVKHSLGTYRNNAWRRFYVFDIAIDKEPEHERADSLEYLPYEIYQPFLEEFELDYIPPLAIIKNGDYEKFINQLEKNVFLIEDGKGIGEGIVLKNYEYYNKYGRQTWAKIITSEFKETHIKTMGAPNINGKRMIEEEIVEQFCTEALIEKTYSKIVVEENGWKSQYIPRLLNTVFYDLIVEESWNIVKKFKNPTVNYKTLQHLVTTKIKTVKKEIFT